MHNLVKEATGIDFNKFGDDLTTAKEVALQTLDIGRDNQHKSSIEACPSVGHVLNEVDQPNLVQKLNSSSCHIYEKIFCSCSMKGSFENNRLCKLSGSVGIPVS